jgi:hypothetical protein
MPLEGVGRGGKSSTKFQARSKMVGRDFATRKRKSKESAGVTLRFRVGGPIKTAHSVGGEQMIAILWGANRHRKRVATTARGGRLGRCSTNKLEVRRLKGALENWGREGKRSSHVQVHSKLVERDLAT